MEFMDMVQGKRRSQGIENGHTAFAAVVGLKVAYFNS